MVRRSVLLLETCVPLGLQGRSPAQDERECGKAGNCDVTLKYEIIEPSRETELLQID